MNNINKKTDNIRLLYLFLLFIMLNIVGCANLKYEVTSLNNSEIASLNAEDIARIMLRAGFEDEQIIKLGTELHNKLLTTGAAQINLDSKVEAMFAVNGNYVYVSSRSRGSFIYDYLKKQAM
jgi:hypothetical protein